jgi:hypothetical protein
MAVHKLNDHNIATELTKLKLGEDANDTLPGKPRARNRAGACRTF